MRAMQMRDMQQRAAYQGQLAQLAGLQMQKEQRALDDDQITRQAYMDAGGDLNQTQQFIRQRGGSPEAAQKIALQQLAIREKVAGTTKEELENTGKRHDQLRGAVLAFEQQPDDVKAQQWPTFVQQQLKNGNLTQDEYNNALQLHPTYPGADQMQLYANGLRTGTQAIEEELKSQQIAEARTKATEARRGAALQALSGLELDQNGQPKDMDAYNALRTQYKEFLPQAPGPGVLPRLITSGISLEKQPEARIAQAKAVALEALRAHPESLNMIVGSVIDPKEPEFMMARNEVQNLLNSGEGLDKINEAIEKNAAVVRQRKSGIAEATAKIPGEVRKTVAVEKAKAAASPDPFSDILDSTARNRAVTDYGKAGDEATTKIQAAQDVRHVIEAAQHGNKAAPAIIPIETLRSYVNRVNRQELEQVQGGGNLYDRLLGKINGLVDGQPIPPDILQGLSQLAEMQERAARQVYDTKFKRIQYTYGAKKLQPENFPTYAPSGGATTRTPMGGYKVNGLYGNKKYIGGDPKDSASWTNAQ
jgi:hypothetical protein